MIGKKLIIILIVSILLLGFYSTVFAQDNCIEKVVDNDDDNYYSFICFQEGFVNDFTLDKLSDLRNRYVWSIALYSIPTYAIGGILTFYSIQSLITLETSIPIYELLFITGDIFYLCSTTASTTAYLYNLRLYKHIINNAISGNQIDWNMLDYVYNFTFALFL